MISVDIEPRGQSHRRYNYKPVGVAVDLGNTERKLRNVSLAIASSLADEQFSYLQSRQIAQLGGHQS